MIAGRPWRPALRWGRVSAMRILMTTGIFEPESGGPATLTPQIAARLVSDGHDVIVLTYSDKSSYDFDSKYTFKLVRVVRTGNRFLNYVSIFFAVLRHIPGRDLVYSLDSLAVGFPVTIAVLLFRTPVVIRVGGDYIWERYLEADIEPMPLTDFYEKNLHEEYSLLHTLIRFVLQRADRVVFNSDMQRKMYHALYGLDPARTSVIYNPVPATDWLPIKRGTPNNEIVFAGRFVVMKNVSTLVRAFAKAKLPHEYRLILIGDGPERGEIEHIVRTEKIQNRVDVLPAMHQAEMYKRIKDCRAIVLPSWTDVAPNQVFEAMRLKIPMIVTAENFLAVRRELPLTIDPRSVVDVALKLEILADDRLYADFVALWNKLSFEHGWDQEMKEHYAVFDSARRK